MPYLRSNSRLLDVGCGTGLSTTLLLQTPVRASISDGVFVDTSEEMLQIARKRARRWPIQCRFALGTIADITQEFDVILVSSVMHHIPDLGAFLEHVTKRLSPGGLFVHLQDPHGDANPEVVRVRKHELQRYVQRRQVSLWDRIKRRLRPRDRYISKTNRELLRRHIISRPLSDEEIWSITDIHDDDRGISLKDMSQVLDNDLTPVTTASYGFFGKLASDLPEELKPVEIQLLEARDMDGTIMCGVWRKP